MKRLAVLALALALLPTVALADDIAGPARVIDGDTIEVAGQRIRLHGIDARGEVIGISETLGAADRQSGFWR